jgi:DNA-directed RNA polymerase subunit A"
MIMLAKKIMQEFENFCERNKIKGEEREKKLAQLEKMIIRYKFEPGEAIGIIAAQSLSEPATQMTMRSYTLASQSDRLSKVTQGLPRLIEIFDARKTFEKTTKIFLTDEYNDKDRAKEVAMRIKATKVSDIIVSDSIDLIEMKIELELDKESDREMMQKLFEKYMKDYEVSYRGKKVIINPKKTDIKSVKKIKNKIMKLHVDGVKGVENVFVVREGDDWIIQTIGSNMKKILKMKEVDKKRTTTNDIHQVLEVLGIEAARNVILIESKDTLDEQGLDVDVRHLMLLADMMTVDGTVKDIGRYGVSGKKTSVLARANFEETKRHLVNASFYGEEDRLEGVIENVLLGRIVPVGTGTVELVVDIEKMKHKKKG